MFDLSTISTMLMPTILVLGLCVGYIVKNLIPNDSVNRFIPLIVGVVGLVAGVVSAITTGTPITLELIVGAILSGLSSTAVYEQFKNLMSEAKKGKIGPNKGKKLSEETRRKISKTLKGNTGTKGKHWYNNGEINIKARECPEGFVPGRIK